MIGFAFPSKDIRKILNNYSDIVFIDDQGFWIYSEESSSRILLPLVNDKKFLKLFNVNKAKKYLDWWLPLWTRWVPNASQYENKKENSIYKIYNIFSSLKYYKINGIIFNTSIAHHLDSSFLSIACRLNKIDQIYLYGQVINGRLLPILQSDDINSRYLLNLELCKFNFEKDIEEFVDRKKNNLLPTQNFDFLPFKNELTLFKKKFFRLLFKNWDKSLLYVILFLIRREIQNLFRQINFPAKARNNLLVPKNVDKYSLVEDLMNINTQRIFIKNLSKEIISKKQIDNFRLRKKPLLLIAAHQQPEATSFPEGDKYYNYIHIIMALRSKNYEDEILYKEHMANYNYLCKIVGLTKVGTCRSIDYLKILKNLGCLFLPTGFNLSIINDNEWYVPVTITGTIAIERSLVGLHTIYTGNPWYKGLPGTIHIDEIESLDSIPINWAKPNEIVAKEAMYFLNNILNNKTLANLSGVANGVPDKTEKSKKDFETGILKILEWFDKKKIK